jgi:anti-sigma B factor antagonist
VPHALQFSKGAFSAILKLQTKPYTRKRRNMPRYGQAAMPLEITQREDNGICILALSGRLVFGQESNGLRSTVDNLLSSGVNRIVINLEHANYIDTTGLGALLETQRTTKAQGGRLTLCNLGPNFKQALEFARLLRIFETFPTEAAAVQSFVA